LDTGFQVVLKLLHVVFFFVPLAVFCVVAAVVAKDGFGAFTKFAYFVIAVLLALALQGVFYMTRLRLGSWVRPKRFFRGSLDALTMAFSTASSTATLPVTYRCAVEKIGLRDENARLGTMVGGNLNNDGTALYEAMAALFVAQALGMHLGMGQQLVVVFMAVIASVGAAGIPEAGLVTMMAVFTAVKLPIDYIPLLLTVDWFLDRCRTAMNVMGDLTVSSLLDGKTPDPASLQAASTTT
jgi:Na+/H+-dicarboxylate symporter